MNRLYSWLTDKLCRALEPHERDTLQGDHAELGISGLRAARETFGLIVRRRLEVSTGGQQRDFLWFSLIPLVPFLVSRSINIADLMMRPPIMLLNPLLTGIAVVIGVMSWTSGFFVAARSGRLLTASTFLLAVVWIVSLQRSLSGLDFGASVLVLHAAMFLLPLSAGWLRGCTSGSLAAGTGAIVAIAPALIVIGIIAYVSTWGQTSGSGGDRSLSSTAAFLAAVFFSVSYPGGLLLVFARRSPRVRHEEAP